MTAPKPAAICLLSVLLISGCMGGPERSNVLKASGEAEVVVMDFATPLSFSPLPEGWYHYKFLTRSPMDIAFATKEGVPAIRLATKASASMLFRHVDIDLQQYPLLAWRWYVEQPIESALDERTPEGDDHPARLFITFQTPMGEKRSMEIIWGNTVLKAGDVKYLGKFPHWVANGGNANIRKWHAEEVDLARIYRRFWPDAGDEVRVVDIALFCDSDETRGASIAYFADVRLKRAR